MLLKLAALKCCIGKLVEVVDLGKCKEKDIYNKEKIGLEKDSDVEWFFLISGCYRRLNLSGPDRSLLGNR